jgi:hypothetical protein
VARLNNQERIQGWGIQLAFSFMSNSNSKNMDIAQAISYLFLVGLELELRASRMQSRSPTT